MNWKRQFLNKYLLSSIYYPGIKHEHDFGENPNPADEDYERYLAELEYWKREEEKNKSNLDIFEMLEVKYISENNYNVKFSFTYKNGKYNIYKAFGYSHGWKFEKGYIEWILYDKEAYRIKNAIKKYSDKTILLK